MEIETGPGYDDQDEFGQDASGATGSAAQPNAYYAGVNNMRPPAYGQGLVVSIGAAVAVLVLAISAVRSGGSGQIPLLQTTRPLFWGLAVIVLIAVAIGAQLAEVSVARAAASAGRLRPDTSLPTAWTVPSVATAAAILMVATYHSQAMLLVGPVIAFFGVAGSLLSRDLLDDATDGTQRMASAIHTIVIHAVAFFGLSAVYLNKMSLAATVPLVMAMSGLLVLETLERSTAPKPRRILYSVLGASVMGAASVMLNWWQSFGWTGGAVLLLSFYLTAGILLAGTQRTAFRTRHLIEFGAIGAVGIILLAVTG